MRLSLIVGGFACAAIGAIGGWVAAGSVDVGTDGLSHETILGDAVHHVAKERGVAPGFTTTLDYRGPYCGGVVGLVEEQGVTYVVVGEDSGDAISRYPAENTEAAAIADLLRDTRCDRS